jgi:hypothetical protein
VLWRFGAFRLDLKFLAFRYLIYILGTDRALLALTILIICV